METIYIKVHSFVDLITNSSSEVFVTVTDKTLKVFEDIINSLIKLQNPESKLTCKDLFEVVEVYPKGEYLPLFKKTKSGYKDMEDWGEYPKDIPLNSPLGELISESLVDGGKTTSVAIIPKAGMEKEVETILAVSNKIKELLSTVEANETYN